jgi:hypothetical protein
MQNHVFSYAVGNTAEILRMEDNSDREVGRCLTGLAYVRVSYSRSILKKHTALLGALGKYYKKARVPHKTHVQAAG